MNTIPDSTKSQQIITNRTLSNTNPSLVCQFAVKISSLSGLIGASLIPPGIWDLNIYAKADQGNDENNIAIKWFLLGYNSNTSTLTNLVTSGSDEEFIPDHQNIMKITTSMIIDSIIDISSYTDLVVVITNVNRTAQSRDALMYFQSYQTYSHIHTTFAVAGPTGPAGIQGPVGGVGPIGPEGPVGGLGPAGPVGPIGSIGHTGPRGERGEKGDDGDTTAATASAVASAASAGLAVGAAATAAAAATSSASSSAASAVSSQAAQDAAEEAEARVRFFEASINPSNQTCSANLRVNNTNNTITHEFSRNGNYFLSGQISNNNFSITAAGNLTCKGLENDNFEVSNAGALYCTSIQSNIITSNIIENAPLRINFADPNSGTSVINIGTNTVNPFNSNRINIGSISDSVYINDMLFNPFSYNTGVINQITQGTQT
jgi:hypothetical protein